jgi:hypothetical protein
MPGRFVGISAVNTEVQLYPMTSLIQRIFVDIMPLEKCYCGASPV